MRKAIFLDRDGTINYDAGYTHRIADWRFLPGAVNALASFKQAGWLLIVVSNQSGIGRGYYTASQLHELEAWVNTQLGDSAIDAWYHCPHLPDAHCDCRKPKPGMLLRAAREMDVCLATSWMIGDKLSDVEAGMAAGCHVGVLGPEWNEARKSSLPANVPVWANLPEAARQILACRDKANIFIEKL